MGKTTAAPSLTRIRLTFLARMLVGIIDLYRWILSPLIGHHCRFHPTCSWYAREAVTVHGVFPGIWYAVKRISRCHPWHDGGIDEVPPLCTKVMPQLTSDPAEHAQ